MEQSLQKRPSSLEKLLHTLDRLQSQIPQAKHDEFLRHVSASAQLVAREYIRVPSEENIGEAYLAFRSDEEPDIVLKGLHEVKERVKAPETLEIILYDQKNQIPQDANLPECWDTIAEWSDEYLRYPYMARAQLKGKTNREVNTLVGDMLGVLLEVDGQKSPFSIYDGNQCTDQQYMRHGRRYIISDEAALQEMEHEEKTHKTSKKSFINPFFLSVVSTS